MEVRLTVEELLVGFVIMSRGVPTLLNATYICIIVITKDPSLKYIVKKYRDITIT